MLLVAAYYLPEAAYPSLVPCSASLSFAPDSNQLPMLLCQSRFFGLEVAADLVAYYCCVLPVPYSLCTGRTVSVQTASHTAVEPTDAHSPLTQDIGVLYSALRV